MGWTFLQGRQGSTVGGLEDPALILILPRFAARCQTWKWNLWIVFVQLIQKYLHTLWSVWKIIIIENSFSVTVTIFVSKLQQKCKKMWKSYFYQRWWKEEFDWYFVSNPRGLQCQQKYKLRERNLESSTTKNKNWKI